MQLLRTLIMTIANQNILEEIRKNKKKFKSVIEAVEVRLTMKIVGLNRRVSNLELFYIICLNNFTILNIFEYKFCRQQKSYWIVGIPISTAFNLCSWNITRLLVYLHFKGCLLDL